MSDNEIGAPAADGGTALSSATPIEPASGLAADALQSHGAEIDFAAIQSALDTLRGTSAEFGFFYGHENQKIYNCSCRLMSGALAYGTGATVEEAYRRSLTNKPIRSEERAA